MKTIITAIPLREDIRRVIYHGADRSLPASDIETEFPIIAFLDAVKADSDGYDVIMLLKTSGYDSSRKNQKKFREQMKAIAERKGVDVTFHEIVTEFSENIDVHQGLMNEIVKLLPDGSTIIADITYGPKDMPMVVLSAIKFAERFLSCTAEHIIYGQGYFTSDNRFVEARLTDMLPLKALDSLIQSIPVSDSKTARELLNNIVIL